MPGDDYLSVPHASDNPAPLNKRSAEDIRAEIARVDAAISAFERWPEYGPFTLLGWHRLADISLPVALKSLKLYRQRLARAGR